MQLTLYPNLNSNLQLPIKPTKLMPIYQSNSLVDLENPSPSIELNPLTNLEKFLSNYNHFIEQHNTLELNTQTILEDISLNILKPPPNAQQELQNLYDVGKNLSRFLVGNVEAHEILSSLKRLRQEKIYETILMIQELNYKLNKDYQEEVSRGIQMGVYNRKVTGQLSGKQENLDRNYREQDMKGEVVWRSEKQNKENCKFGQNDEREQNSSG